MILSTRIFATFWATESLQNQFGGSSPVSLFPQYNANTTRPPICLNSVVYETAAACVPLDYIVRLASRRHLRPTRHGWIMGCSSETVKAGSLLANFVGKLVNIRRERFFRATRHVNPPPRRDRAN